MLRLFVLIFFVFLVVPLAAAKTPPEVLTPYKSYKSALATKDYKKAADHAYDAWQKAEALMGDSKTTGDLAQNYADLGYKAELKYKSVKPALLRSIALAEEPVMRLQREVAFALFATKHKKNSDFKKRFEDIVAFAESNDLSNSTFLGEIYTIRAELSNEKMNEVDVAKYSRKALEIFETTSDGYTSVHPWIARLFSGYAYEYDDNLIPALMEYQAVMENTEQALPKDHPFVMKALGRWMLMRDRINREGKIQDAEKAGMCECWPYDKPRNENVKPVKRVPPDMPSNAWISGYAIVEVDLEDDGSVRDTRILTSWPPELYDRSSLKAVRKWKYSPRTADETDSDRTGLVSTIRYRLKMNGKIVE